MSSRDYMLGLMAASIYEPLTESEALELETWLQANPDMRVELEEMRAFAAFLPNEAPAFTGNLLHAVQEDIRRGAGSAWDWSLLPRFAFQVLGTLTVAAVLAFPIAQGMQMGFLSAGPAAPLAGAAGADSLLANVLIATQEQERAYALLDDALKVQPTNKEAGTWQLKLAELDYDYFQRYQSALDRYIELRQTHPEVYASNPLNPYRYDLLEQTQPENFEPLHTIARAQQDGMRVFPQLEQVVARYAGPANPVAELALAAMCDLSGALGENSDTFKMAGYEQLRRHCTNPVALDQVEMSLGEMYLAHTKDYARAAELLRAAASSPHPAVSDAAAVSLARLEPAFAE
jgi:tetratricopeptide (TPR) repeat protein